MPEKEGWDTITRSLTWLNEDRVWHCLEVCNHSFVIISSEKTILWLLRRAGDLRQHLVHSSSLVCCDTYFAGCWTICWFDHAGSVRAKLGPICLNLSNGTRVVLLASQRTGIVLLLPNGIG
jgi:hypothetical protein